MNPPDRPLYRIVLLVNESLTNGSIISFENVLDKTSSLSSGALADHSSLSDTSENCNVTPPIALPQISRSEDHLSVSTSSSSGLSVSQNLLRGRSVKPCPCSVPALQSVKLNCVCGKSSCALSLKELSIVDHQGVDPEGPDSGRHLENAFHSDMDLTDPVIQCRTSTDESEIPAQQAPDEGKPIILETQPSEDSFPKIRLSLRPTCELQVPFAPVPSTSNRLDADPTEIEDQESDEVEEGPQLWDWTKQIERAFCFEEKLPKEEWKPQIPSHWVEDENAVLYHMVWLILTEHARVRLDPPPNLTTRVWHDPAVREYPWPDHIYKCFAHMTNKQIEMLLDDFARARSLAFGRFPKKRISTEPADDFPPPMDTPDIPEIEISDSETSEAIDQCPKAIEPVLHEDDQPTAPCSPSPLPEEISSSPPSPETVKTQKRKQEESLQDSDAPSAAPSPPAKRARVDSPCPPDVSDQNVATAVAPQSNLPPGILLVYARCDKWYYPGVVRCTVEGWDNATEPLKVSYYDKTEADLVPDQIFPIERLIPGAIIQCQTAESLYEDVFFLSFSPRPDPKGLPSAVVQVQDPEEGQSKEVTFDNTALSPKDVIRLRSALKGQFYPSKIRQNFTEVSAGAILFTASRRRRAQPTSQPEEKEKTSTQSAQPTSKSSTTASGKSQPSKKSSKTDDTKSIKKSDSSKSDKDYSWTKPIATIVKECSRYKCSGKNCVLLFKSVAEVKDHQNKVKTGQHEGQALVYQCDAPKCSNISYSREQFRKHIWAHRNKSQDNTTSVPRPKAETTKTTFVRPSTSGLKSARAARTVAPSDSDTDTSPARKWASPMGYGLQKELVVLGDTAKSYTGLKTLKKNEVTTEIFKGLHFVLTKGIDTSGRSVAKKRPADSESDSTDVENYYHSNVKFEPPALQRLIEIGGGRLYEDISSVPGETLHDDPDSVIIVSNHPCCTANYIYGVALGLTILRHDTIIDCARKQVSLRSVLSAGSADLLPPGWDNLRNTWVAPRASQVTPLKGHVVLTYLSEKSFWHHIIRLMGGRGVEWLQFLLSPNAGILAVVADHSLPESKRIVAHQRRLPVISTEWLIQAVITGGKPPFSKYILPSPTSSN